MCVTKHNYMSEVLLSAAGVQDTGACSKGRGSWLQGDGERRGSEVSAIASLNLAAAVGHP